MSGERLRAARMARGWSQDQVVRLLIRRAQATGHPPGKPSSLKTALSRWENGRVAPDAGNRRYLREIYGSDDAELGFPADPGPGETSAELRDRLVTARTIDADTVELFRRETDSARAIDRKYGAAAVLERIRGDIHRIGDTLAHAILLDQRTELAAALSSARTLAGWAALDIGGVDQAWRHYTAAKAAAREAESDVLLLHAEAEQAMLLLDVGETATAVALLGQLIERARHTPVLFRSWLVATWGEAHAAHGDADNARRAFDTAATLLPEQRRHPLLPFVFLDPTNLERWRGHALTRLGDPDAADAVSGALSTPLSARAHARMLVDLAYAHAATGDRFAALDRAREARRVAARIGSVRELARLDRLHLPG